MYVPVAGARVSSGFLGGFRSTGGHSGIDFAGRGQALVVAPGTVISVGWGGAYGNLVKIRHYDGTVGYYAHLSRASVRVGQAVGRGSTVGIVGQTGNATGYHLHFEVRRNGTPVNPAPWLNANYKATPYSRSTSAPESALGPGRYGGQRLSAEQLRNAQTIIGVGRQMGASQRDLTIALMTAYQESRLLNLNYGDRDSRGLFQQRPSAGWGSVAQVTNPLYSARKFFEGLFKVSNRGRLSLTQAAQAVQRSAFPNAYARWEGLARAILGGSLGEGVDMGPDAMGLEPEPEVAPMIPTTASGAPPLSTVGPRGLYSVLNSRQYAYGPRMNPDAKLDTSQINDQRWLTESTNQRHIRNMLHGTEDEVGFNRSTSEPNLREILYGN